MTEAQGTGQTTPGLGEFRRIVVKIGSALLVGPRGLRQAWLASLAGELAARARAGTQIIIVSSGAIALGCRKLRLERQAIAKLDESQAAAAIGQIELARAWARHFAGSGLRVGQVLLTIGDTEQRRNYLNARATLGTLLKLGAVPVINENDTVATTEIRYGDNDRLAARVAVMTSADCLVLLSDIDGLYSADPATDRQARHIPLVPQINAAIERMAQGPASAFARGGMITKIEAAKIATRSGVTMAIARGAPHSPLSAMENGARATWFLPVATPARARKAWISGQLTRAGTLTVDSGAARALKDGKSLLAAGVRSISGTFGRGEAVSVMTDDGREIGCGLVAYDAHEARRIQGRASREISTILGYDRGPALIHRDDLVLQESIT